MGGRRSLATTKQQLVFASLGHDGTAACALLRTVLYLATAAHLAGKDERCAEENERGMPADLAAMGERRRTSREVRARWEGGGV